MDSLPTILCVGTLTLDMVLSTPRLPSEDERVEAKEAALVGGGNAANAAVAMARLGLPVEFCGTVGDDRAGMLILDDLASEGVGTSLVERRTGVATAQSAVVISGSTGARTIVTHPAPPPPPIPTGFDIVHLDKAGWKAMPASGIPGSRISVDDGNIIADLDVSLLEWYMPTAIVLRQRYVTHDAVEGARRARAAGATTVVATSGFIGSFALNDENLFFAPALSIRPRSTLGAGDVFHGAFVAAMALELPLAAAIRFANITAALSCRGLDGRSGIPGRREVETTMDQLESADLSFAEIVHRFSDSDGN